MTIDRVELVKAIEGRVGRAYLTPRLPAAATWRGLIVSDADDLAIPAFLKRTP